MCVAGVGSPRPPIYLVIDLYSELGFITTKGCTTGSARGKNKRQSHGQHGSAGWSFCPIHQKLMSSVPSQGTYRGCGFSPWLGRIQKVTNWFLSLFPSLSSPPVLSLSLSKSSEKVSSGEEVQADSGVWRNIQYSVLSFLRGHWECKKCSTCDFSAQGAQWNLSVQFLLKADYVGTVLAALKNQTPRRKAGLQNSSQSLHK